MNNINLTIYINYYFEYYGIVISYAIGNLNEYDYVKLCKEIRNQFINLDCSEPILELVEELVYESTKENDLSFSMYTREFVSMYLQSKIKGVSIELQQNYIKFQEAYLLNAML